MRERRTDSCALGTLPRVLVAALAMAASARAQQTWYVDDDATPPGAGTSLAPFPTIQAAIEASSDGDLVSVAPGTYRESIDCLGKAISIVGVAGPAATVLEPPSGMRGATFRTGETRASLLQGVTLTKGGIQQGGGVLCNGAGPTIRDCIVENNLTVVRGGGIACVNGSTARIEDCLVRGNSSQPTGGIGGGIFVKSSTVEIVGNRILENYAFSDPEGFGGGLYLWDSTVLLRDNVIAGNFVTDYGGNAGGGIFATGTCELTVQGNVVADNVAASGTFGVGVGGGMVMYSACTADLRNNVFWGNSGELGSQLACFGSALAEYNVFQGGLEDIAGKAQLQVGAGNLSADPLFVAPRSRDYHVEPVSPVVDAGDPATPPGGTDGDLDPRRLDGNGDGTERIDIGWDEVNPTEFQIVGALSPGTSVSLKTGAPPGQVFLHLVGLRAIDLSLPPFGALLVGGPLVRIGSGAVPGATDLVVPPDPSLVGMRLHFQSLAHRPDAPIGSFSRRIPEVVQ